jgi:dTDP-glucose 4,6-dehydratase
LLVAGGAGFIGANFVRYMLKTHLDYRLVVYDKLTYAGNPNNLVGLAEEYGDRYVFVQGDICDLDAVTCTMAKYQIDGIVNFAAETHVDRSLMTPGDFARTNVYGAWVLLEQAKRFGIRRYHQVSTDEVYGQILWGSFKETAPINCRSPYSASKAGGDVMCLAYFTSFGVPVTISRGSNNVGPYQHVEKAVPLFVTNALDNLPLPIYGDGLYERDYLYVLDHCQGIDLILHRGKSGEVYNLGSGREMTAVDLAKRICDLLDKPYSLLRFVDDRPGQDRRYRLDCSKLIALDWRPTHTIEQALEKTVRWYVENEWWWRKVKQGEYREYYQRQYGERLKRATRTISVSKLAPETV